ncbi:MAG: chorismate mutase [Candidatus Heimdallarchaeota archaeon]
MQELEDYRQQIREINMEILRLLRKRLDVVKKIGILKKRKDIPIRNVEVETRQLRELTRYGNELELDSKFVEDIFKRCFTYAVKVQEKMEI